MLAPPPPIGAYLRPVGRPYAYCYRVIAVTPATDGDMTVWELERWGMTEEHAPVRDGHQHTRWLRDLRPAGQGVWRRPHAPIWGEPLYYRQISELEQTGQLQLF